MQNVIYATGGKEVGKTKAGDGGISSRACISSSCSSSRFKSESGYHAGGGGGEGEGGGEGGGGASLAYHHAAAAVRSRFKSERGYQAGFCYSSPLVRARRRKGSGNNILFLQLIFWQFSNLNWLQIDAGCLSCSTRRRRSKRRWRRRWRRRRRWRITFPCSNEHPLISPPLPAPAQRCKLQQKTMRDCASKYCNIAINCKDMLGKAFLFYLLVVQVQYLLYKYTYKYKYNTVLLPPLEHIFTAEESA